MNVGSVLCHAGSLAEVHRLPSCGSWAPELADFGSCRVQA